jgi:hypothetical protein
VEETANDPGSSHRVRRLPVSGGTRHSPGKSPFSVTVRRARTTVKRSRRLATMEVAGLKESNTGAVEALKKLKGSP